MGLQMDNEQEFTNPKALDDLLDAIEGTSLTQRDKGTRFETLVREWLTNEPSYSDLFTEVQTYADWAEGHQNLAPNRKDTGIDLVATNARDGKFTAIQCKFYSKDARIGKDGIDSFISDSNHDFFSARYLVTTSNNFTDNALQELRRKEPPITLIKRSDLEASAIDWQAYLKDGQVRQRNRRRLRDYQKEALEKVIRGFREHDRGKLIMACGSGKTFTALKIAEEQVGNKGFALFLVPSLSLLSQTLRDWKQQASSPMTAFGVCSDAKTGKADNNDIADVTAVDDLNYPATTNAKALAWQVKELMPMSKGMTVVFSTYQSLDVVSRAQLEFGMPGFDLIICDEAHRTTGYKGSEDQEDPMFSRVHDGGFVIGKKRLYMTATPKMYGEKAKEQKDSGEISELYSMDDEQKYGPEFFKFTFNEAVGKRCLVDYKVIVLTVDDSLLGESFIKTQEEIAEQGGLNIPHAAKIVGCYKALSKTDLQNEVSIADDRGKMKRAVAFAQIINTSEVHPNWVSSKQFAKYFSDVVDRFKQEYEVLNKDSPGFDAEKFEETYSLSCSCRHIDGSMNAIEKDSLLSWLREEPEDNECKVLFNVRCLSEGVDVPALDAIIFLSPRKSQVDVVQSVGRVMRISPGKKRGYVIIPIVVPEGMDPSYILDNNSEFKTVWQVLGALKSLDDNFGAIVDGELKKIDSDRLAIISLGKPEKEMLEKIVSEQGDTAIQTSFDFYHNIFLEGQIHTAIVKKLGNRREWGDWAEDVGRICQSQADHINKIIHDPSNSMALEKFNGFRDEMKATLNDSISDEEIVEMLSQHLVIKPVMDALFRDYPFTEQNPISKAMSSITEALDAQGVKTANRQLEGFYEAVQYRMKGIRTSAQRQTVILELFDKFFKYAFPKQQERLGIVYTPVEIVDFINKSVAGLLKKEFNTDISDRDVHIYDPFTGTGTFITRLLQSGLIKEDALKYKYEHDIHASEIVPLAYYIASMNIETVYHEKTGDGHYEPNNVMIFTDTFENHAAGEDLFKSALMENNKRLSGLNKAPIKIIIGNPPYSVGQESQNDNNQNTSYPDLDARIDATYAQRSTATLKKSLYDSYIRAYRYATDRIDSGIIGFVTNAGWLDTGSADGMRKCMAEEFSSIYIYHLKGNQRTSGEQSKREGGKIFGSGSRAPIAIVLLVKNPEKKGPCQIHFSCVDDYLTREKKLEEVSKSSSVLDMRWDMITPDKHGDWLNQRDESFGKFISIGDKKERVQESIFMNYSRGILTSRDVWVYNSDGKTLEEKVKSMIAFYNCQAELIKSDPTHEIDLDKKNMAWDLPQKRDVMHGKYCDDFITAHLYTSLYRPFFKQRFYFDRYWNNRVYQMPQIFPDSNAKNLIITVNQSYKGSGFIALMSSSIVDVHFNGDSQCFPRYLYTDDKSKGKKGQQDLFSVPGRSDAISKDAVDHFRQAYQGHETSIDADSIFYYIYGLLHSRDYREKYANNLSKELPRIPRVATYAQFQSFEKAGRALADIHVNYEKAEPYKECKIEAKGDSAAYRVTQMRYGKIPGKKGNEAKDKSTIVYNHDITIREIPLKAQEYVVNKKSALDWLVERCCVSTDTDTGIVNDFNDYARDQGGEKYTFDLVLRIITVSIGTVDIVNALPPLEIHDLDK